MVRKIVWKTCSSLNKHATNVKKIEKEKKKVKVKKKVKLHKDVTAFYI